VMLLGVLLCAVVALSNGVDGGRCI
jgi:hypothetical protein